MNFVHQGFRKSDIHAYRQTDRQTDKQTNRQTRPKLYTNKRKQNFWTYFFQKSGPMPSCSLRPRVKL